MTDNRTWLASVLFLDIVGYTKVPVDQQMAIKLHFSSVVTPLVADLKADECLQLDTGDGCAICYLGDPERIYTIALELQSAFRELASTQQSISYQVRLGLNLGPIKIVDGISGEKNCVGSGINDAQRIMDFAEVNQLLVSKSYFDIVCNMSSIYAEELIPAASRTDKHNKVHEIYELISNRSTDNKPSVSQSSQSSQSSEEIDSSVKERIQKEYASLVGSGEAETQMQAGLKASSSPSELCEYLASTLNEDDRYHFNEFTRYYGYSKK